MEKKTPSASPLRQPHGPSGQSPLQAQPWCFLGSCPCALGAGLLKSTGRRGERDGLGRVSPHPALLPQAAVPRCPQPWAPVLPAAYWCWPLGGPSSLLWLVCTLKPRVLATRPLCPFLITLCLSWQNRHTIFTIVALITSTMLCTHHQHL